jgi:ABC-type Zn uptake system ZnuABC Zn-binding protein ZnuA
LVLVLALALAGCASAPSAVQIATPDALGPVSLGPGQGLNVVATNSLVGDVVQRVGGDRIRLKVLIPPGTDPHSYVPRPADSAAVYDAQVLFASGAGLETFLSRMLKNAGGHAPRIELSDGLALHPLEAHDGEAVAAGHGPAGEVDPHVWFDVLNVIRWTEEVEQTLSALDPAGAETYRTNAAAYIAELKALDAWVVAETGQVPAGRRKLVINHPVLGYFAARYGFEQLGAVYPLSPSAEPSAADVAALEEAIRQFGVPAVFAENTVSSKLAEQVSKDTGVKLVRLYTDSLGGPGSGASTYLDMMRYDVSSIVAALK